jgi:hypothetical protein
MDQSINQLKFLTYKVFTFTPPSPAPNSSFCNHFKSTKRQNGDLRLKKMEHCKNPWIDACKSENIKLYIQIKGEKLPICQQCWNKIADQEQEW